MMDFMLLFLLWLTRHVCVCVHLNWWFTASLLQGSAGSSQLVASSTTVMVQRKPHYVVKTCVHGDDSSPKLCSFSVICLGNADSDDPWTPLASHSVTQLQVCVGAIRGMIQSAALRHHVGEIL